MGTGGVAAGEAEDTANGGEQDQQQHEQPQKKAKRLPAFAAAILKRFNEKDTKKNKDKDNQETSNIVEGAELDNAIDGNDNEPKQDKQLVYAELVLKPANETTAASAALATTPAAGAATAATSPEGPAGGKSSTEYAEIVYVQKGGDDKK